MSSSMVKKAGLVIFEEALPELEDAVGARVMEFVVEISGTGARG